jgi:predicted ATPase
MITLKKIAIEGYKSIAKAEVELRDLNVIVGANGSGKSNFIGVFKFLTRIVTKKLQETIASDPDRFMFHGRKKTESIDITYDFGANKYEISLISSQDTMVFKSELIEYAGRFNYGESLGYGHKESLIQNAAQSHSNKIPRYVFNLVNKIHIYHFHDTSDGSPAKSSSNVDDNRILNSDASNLASYLYLLQKNDLLAYDRIVSSIRLVAPYFDTFILEPLRNNESKIKLVWRQKGSDAYFDAFTLSDGTLRFICLATLLLQSSPPSIVLLDEPELGLHPSAITLLAEMLESAAKRVQVIVATQSVTLLNHFTHEHIIVAEHDGLATTFNRLDETELAPWLENYSMGELWEKNVIGGRP